MKAFIQSLLCFASLHAWGPWRGRSSQIRYCQAEWCGAVEMRPL